MIRSSQRTFTPGVWLACKGADTAEEAAWAGDVIRAGRKVYDPIAQV
jgi:hypothetical protein